MGKTDKNDLPDVMFLSRSNQIPEIYSICGRKKPLGISLEQDAGEVDDLINPLNSLVQCCGVSKVSLYNLRPTTDL